MTPSSPFKLMHSTPFPLRLESKQPAIGVQQQKVQIGHNKALELKKNKINVV